MDLNCKAGCAALTMCACSPEVKKAGCPALPELAEAAEHEKNDFMVRAETLLQNEASKKDLKSKKYVERDAHIHSINKKTFVATFISGTSTGYFVWGF